jgi:hypothetical protein
MMGPRLTSILLAVGALSGLACHRQPALTTPASDQNVYAARYPERLRELRSRFAADAEKTLDSFDALRALPASVPPSNADELEQVVRRADAGGRSQPYVDEALRQEDIDALMNENRSAIRRRVAGSVAFAAKEKECIKEDIDAFAGTAATATDRAVDRQLEERLRARNPAHRYLQMHADELGEQRVNALERPVDTLTRASFVANVRLALYRLELADLLDQEKAVRTTLERDEADSRASLESAGLSKSYRLAVEEQIAKDEAARLALPTEVAASRAAEQDMEARAEALQKDYQSLLESLLAEIEERKAKAAAAPAKPAPAPKTPSAPAPADPASPAPAAPATPGTPSPAPATPAPAAPAPPAPAAPTPAAPKAPVGPPPSPT